MNIEERRRRVLAHLRSIAPEGDPGNLESVSRARAEGTLAATEEGLESASGPPSMLQEAASKLLDRPEALTDVELGALEAIILPAERPVVDVVGGGFKAPDWRGGLLAREPVAARVRRALPAVGRVELAPHFGLPFGGTAFLVGPGLMMTNRHVAAIFGRGLGLGPIAYSPGSAAVDLLREADRSDTRLLEVTGVRMIHPWWDMALLDVRGDLGGLDPLTLSDLPPADAAGRPVVVIGYPALDSRNDLEVQRKVFHSRFDVKRLLPGLAGPMREVRSFEQTVPALCHDASTLGGASGSAVLDLESGEVLGLHFAGIYLDSNFCVPAWSLLADGRVREVGVQGRAVQAPRPRPWERRWAELEETGGETSRAREPARSPTVSAASVGAAAPVVVDAARVEAGALSFEIPLRVSIRLGEPTVSGPGAVRPPSAPPPWALDEAPDESGLRAAFAERAAPGDEAVEASVEAPGAAMPRTAVRLVRDDESPCLRHLGAPLSDRPFQLTAAVLERLVQLNAFGEGLSAWGDDLVLVGLRGCRLAEDPDAFPPARDLQPRLGFPTDGDRQPDRLPLWGSTGGFVRTATLVEDTVTHVLPRCLVGIWRRSTGELALMRGTTAPNWDYSGLAVAARRNNDASAGDANLLLTGLYRYEVGHHKYIPDAFRLQNADHGAVRVAAKGKAEISYTVRDRYWRVGSWPSQDNLHPSMAGAGSARDYVFHYSAGCTTVQGRYDQDKRRHEGAWSVLRTWAGLSGRAVDEAAIGARRYSYVLLTGRDARLAAEGSGSLGRLRYGSRGPAVRTLQRSLAQALGKPPAETGVFDGPTQERLVMWQWTRGLNQQSWDGVLGPAEAAQLGVTLAP